MSSIEKEKYMYFSVIGRWLSQYDNGRSFKEKEIPELIYEYYKMLLEKSL